MKDVTKPSTDVPILTMNQLGELIRGFRKQEGLTQRKLAQRVGTSQAAISMLETDPGQAYVDRFFRVLAELDLELVVRRKQSRVLPTEW